MRKKLDKKDDLIAQWYFNEGDKLFLCSDGIADNFSNSEIADYIYKFSDSRECLMNIVNGIYDIEKQKLTSRTNNPPQYLESNSNFKDTLKGSGDNMSAIIVEKGDSDGR